MIACTDVFYLEDKDEANAAIILFEAWESTKVFTSYTLRLQGIAPYEPGAFYKRELPCLLALAKKSPVPIDAFVIDGFVWLDEGKPGLGAHLHTALGGIVVVGVAKSSFKGGSFATQVRRGESDNPLWVTAAGMDTITAADCIKKMAGPYRMPKMLKDVDTLSREV